MSRWKVAATAKVVCRHGNLPHLFSLDPESLCYGELSPLQPQSTSIYSVLYHCRVQYHQLCVT